MTYPPPPPFACLVLCLWVLCFIRMWHDTKPMVYKPGDFVPVDRRVADEWRQR